MLNSIDYADKRLLAAVRELHELSQKRFTVVKVDKPIQRGWRRFYVLSEDARRRHDHLIIEAILHVIGTVIVQSRPDFLKRRFRRSKKLVSIEQPLRPISIHEWKGKNYPDAWLRYFNYELLLGPDCVWRPHFVFASPTLYELRVEPNWLWYFREINPAFDSRLSELESWIESRLGWQRYNWLKGRNFHWRRWKRELSWRDKSLLCEHQREIRCALDHYPEVDPAASSQCPRFSFRPRAFTFLAEAFSSRLALDVGEPFFRGSEIRVTS